MDFLDDAIDAGCDVFITADVRYHEAMDAIDKDIALIDGTHYATENIIVPVLADYLRKKLSNRGVRDVEVLESSVDGQTFVHI